MKLSVAELRNIIGNVKTYASGGVRIVAKGGVVVGSGCDFRLARRSLHITVPDLVAEAADTTICGTGGEGTLLGTWRGRVLARRRRSSRGGRLSDLGVGPDVSGGGGFLRARNVQTARSGVLGGRDCDNLDNRGDVRGGHRRVWRGCEWMLGWR